MTTSVACRRRHNRHQFPVDAGARVEFGYPNPRGERVSMRLRDISASGLSFLVSRELPGLEEGRCIDTVTISWGTHEIHADLLVMHLTPDAGVGAVCGALIYPLDDKDIITLQSLAVTP